MDERLRQELESSAAESARLHPVDIDRAVREGSATFRVRLALLNAVVILAGLLGTVLVGLYAVADADSPKGAQTGAAVMSESPSVSPSVSPSPSPSRSPSRPPSKSPTPSPTPTPEPTPTPSPSRSGSPSPTPSPTPAPTPSPTPTPTAAPVLVSIDVGPDGRDVCAPFTQQFAVTATYSDGTTSPLPDSVTVKWTSSAPTVFPVDEFGLVTPKGSGSADITAAVGDLGDFTKISCTPVGRAASR